MRKATGALVVLWLGAITAANLITTHYAAEGHPEVSVYTAAGLVAFDLVARDVLHDWYAGMHRVLLLGALIVAGGVISYLVNADSAEIAKWSAIAFAAAMIVDSVVYHAVRRMPWEDRSNVSNVAAAITDSAVFCAGVGFPFIVAFGQATAKIAGGVVFVLLLARVFGRLRPVHHHTGQKEAVA